MLRLFTSAFFLFPLLLSAQLTLVTDLTPGPDDAFECFQCLDQPLVKFGARWVTVAGTPEVGQELMLLEGDSITLLADVNPGADDSNIAYLRQYGGLAYFAAKDDVNGGAIWVTDGTTEGTTLFFDPDESNTSRSVTGYEFGPDGALYVALGDDLFRFFDGTATPLAGDVDLSAPGDNFPGGSLTAYQSGVAYVSNQDDFFGGGLFLATDTVRQLARIENQSRFDQAFGLREVNGNLLFSLQSNQDSRLGTYLYATAADTLTRYLDENDEPIFVSRWYDLNDSLVVGKVGDDYYTFDGLNAPVLLYTGAGFNIVARVEAPSLRVDSLLFLQTDGGVFNDPNLIVTDGTEAGTTVLIEDGGTAITNLVEAGGFVFFATIDRPTDDVPFYRYEIATGELTEFFTAPARADLRSYEIQLLGVLDGNLYLTTDTGDGLGRELYRVDPGVDIVSVFSRPLPPALEVEMTAESFTVIADRPGRAQLTVLDLGGRVLERRQVTVNERETFARFSGMRIFVFEYNGKLAVRKVVGR